MIAARRRRSGRKARNCRGGSGGSGGDEAGQHVHSSAGGHGDVGTQSNQWCWQLLSALNNCCRTLMCQMWTILRNEMSVRGRSLQSPDKPADNGDPDSHRVHGRATGSAEQAARNAKWKLSIEPCLVTKAGGKSAGTAVATRSYIGMSVPKAVEATHTLHAQGRFAMRRVSAMGKGHTALAKLHYGFTISTV